MSKVVINLVGMVYYFISFGRFLAGWKPDRTQVGILLLIAALSFGSSLMEALDSGTKEKS